MAHLQAVKAEKKRGEEGGERETGGMVGGRRREEGRDGRTEGVYTATADYTMMGSQSPIEMSLLVLYSSVGRAYLGVRDNNQNLQPNDMYVNWTGDRALLENSVVRLKLTIIFVIN